MSTTVNTLPNRKATDKEAKSLRRMRRQYEVSQLELAERVGVSDALISAIEHCKRTVTVADVAKMKAALMAIVAERLTQKGGEPVDRV
jgi:predicted transcriptional regulator